MHVIVDAVMVITEITTALQHKLIPSCMMHVIKNINKITNNILYNSHTLHYSVLHVHWKLLSAKIMREI